MTEQTESEPRNRADLRKEVDAPARRLGRPREWQGEVKRIGDLSADQIALWRHLVATRHELRSPYFSFEFARAVADAGARARVCILYANGSLAGFFPFQFSSPVTRAIAAGERIGGTLNDFCGVIVDRSQHPAIPAVELLRCADLAAFDFSHLEETQLELGLQGVADDAARIRLDGGEERYWARIKSDHRTGYENLRNRERKIEREFRSVDFVFCHEAPVELLKLLVAEKRKQYQRTGVGDGFDEEWKLRCLQRIASCGEGRCLPVLSSLYLDGHWAALHFGFRAGNVLHSAFPVYNPEFAKLSPGLVLLAKIVRNAARHDIYEVDLSTLGSSGYKALFANEIYRLYRGAWHRPSARGLAYRGYLSVTWRLRQMRKGSS